MNDDSAFAILDRLLSIEELRRLNDRYVSLIDGGHLDEFAALFQNATWKGLDGSESIRTWLEENVILYGETPKTHHLVSGLRIDVDGDSASGESIITVLQQHPETGVVSVITVNDYTDTYVRSRGVWRFATRSVVRRLQGDMSLHVR